MVPPRSPCRDDSSGSRKSGLVLSKPGIEGQQVRIERTRERDVAAFAEFFVEERLEVEHVAEVVGARKAKRAVVVEGHVVEPDLLPKRLGEFLRPSPGR